MIKEYNSLIKLPTETVRRKISRKTNLKVFVVIAIITIIIGIGGLIYSILAASFYYNKNPWANAILLDDKITRMVNSQLSQPLVNEDGTAKPAGLGSYVHFNVGEKPGVDIYANLTNSQIIQNIFANDKWIKNNLSIVKTMLAGTGATLSGTQVRYQNQVLNLILRPKILSYPYNDNDDKYGLVKIKPVDISQGLFTYQVRFALQLIATDFASYYVDLKKTFDYTYDTTESSSPVVLTLSQLLNLISNEKISNLIQKYNIRLDAKNEVILSSLLKEYYPIARPDNSIQIDQEVVNKNNIPFAPKVGLASADDLTLNVKYNSKKFDSLQQFGAQLFTYHQENYFPVANIFTKLGVQMPVFENVKNSYDLYDRTSDNTFIPNAMINEWVTSYQGYIKELGLNSDNMTDNFNFNTNDSSQYVWGSEHQIFSNEVRIKFLNINNNLDNNVYRPPTKIYYDQQSYADRSINFQGFNLEANVKEIIEKVQYDDVEATIDQRLTNQIEIIKTNLKGYLLQQLDTPYTKINNIVKAISVGVASNPSAIEGTTFIKQRPINGSSRGGDNKVYQDKLLTVPKIIITVQFSYDGSLNNLYNLTYQYDIAPKVIKDFRGVNKNNLNVLQSDFRLTNSYTTLDKITTLQNDYHQQIVNVANRWENNNPLGTGTTNNNYPVESSSKNAFTIKVKQINVGRNNNNNLRVGGYNADIIATKESLNYHGVFTTGIINVTAASIANITAGYLTVNSSWTQQQVYRQIRTNILRQASFYGLNLTKNDFMIRGISENNLEKLPVGNQTVTVTAVGNDNIVAGTTRVNLIVNAIGIEKYNGNINLGSQKIGSSVNTVTNIIFDQLQGAINEDEFEILNLPQYFNVNIYDKNSQLLNARATFLTTGKYWYEINVTNLGIKYFRGQIWGGHNC